MAPTGKPRGKRSTGLRAAASGQAGRGVAAPEVAAKRRRSTARPYWEAKSLDQMTRPEWEQLCDGCGQCCMLKLEDEDTAKIFMTRLACKLLDIGSCRCKSYPDRHDFVPDCVVLQPETVATYSWLPRTCAYRLLSEGKPLAWWHPLISGTADTVHEAGISVRTWARSEKGVKPSAISRYIIEEV